MKKIITSLLVVFVSIVACQSGSPSTTQTNDVSTMVASTLQAITQTAPSGTPVNFKNVSMLIPKELATGADGESVPAATEDQGGPWGVAPEYIQFTLNGYASLGTFLEKQISIYPAQEYAAANDSAAQSLARLQAILASPSAPITLQTFPHIPAFNAAAMIVAQTKILNFQSGTGVRDITQFGQAVGPVTNNGAFYNFQGLTRDGKYYIIAVLPIGAPFLAYDDKATPPQPADGIPFTYNNNMDVKAYEDYFNAVTAQLNTTDSDIFQPSLTVLDNLIQSISIK